MSRGHILLVLSAHKPYLKRAETPVSEAEREFLDAMTGCYLPLLEMLDRLAADKVPTRLTLSLSPTLVAMMEDGDMMDRLAGHLDSLVRLTRSQLERNREDETLAGTIAWYEARTSRLAALLKSHDSRPARGFRRHLEEGRVDLLTSALTHAYLPLLTGQPEFLRAQIVGARQCHESFFGIAPQGFWLPECGYSPELNAVLVEAGFRYTFVDAIALMLARPRTPFGTAEPVYTPEGLAVFGRHRDTETDIASTPSAYQNDPVYRDPARDIGFDESLDALAPFLPPNGERVETGLKYYARGGPGRSREVYQPGWGEDRAAQHAADFLKQRQARLESLAAQTGREPVIVGLYEAERFGLGWHEGISWIEQLCRKAAENRNGLRMSTAADCLAAQPELAMSSPAAGSWGLRGFHETWVNDSNADMQPHMDRAMTRLEAICRTHPHPGKIEERALNQAVRELMLALASDWSSRRNDAVNAGAAASAWSRHLRAALGLMDEIENGRYDTNLISALETAHPCFPGLSYRILVRDSQ